MSEKKNRRYSEPTKPFWTQENTELVRYNSVSRQGNTKSKRWSWNRKAKQDPKLQNLKVVYDEDQGLDGEL